MEVMQAPHKLHDQGGFFGRGISIHLIDNVRLKLFLINQI